MFTYPYEIGLIERNHLTWDVSTLSISKSARMQIKTAYLTPRDAAM
jgi:hypothetical protein